MSYAGDKNHPLFNDVFWPAQTSFILGLTVVIRFSSSERAFGQFGKSADFGLCI